MLAPGHCIAGRHRLIRLLGRGGMGEVWHTRNEAVERDFAIKILATDGEDSGEIPGKRLLREGRAAGRLRHPNIVEIFDAAVDPEVGPYVVMELLDGNSLAESLKGRTALPIECAVHLGATIADALHVAHEAGVIHRDLKAANVFLHRTSAGTVVPKLVDFGISKLREVTEEQVTVEGAVLGSPLSMSPEQAMGRSDVDRRTDLWSLGVLLYRMVAGRNPFRGATPGALLRAIVMDDPTPSRDLAPDAPPELHALIDRCLCKEPRERPETALEVHRALREIVEKIGLAAPDLGSLLVDDHERTRELSAEREVITRTEETPAMLPLPATEPETTVEAPKRRSRATAIALAVGACGVLAAIVVFARSPREVPVQEPPPVAAAAPPPPPPVIASAVSPTVVESPVASIPQKPKPVPVQPKKPAAAPKTKVTTTPHDPVKHADF